MGDILSDDTSGRIRTPMSPATWTADAAQPEPEPETKEAEPKAPPKAEPKKKAS
jgi:hypothetical protein